MLRVGKPPETGRRYRHRPGVYAILPLGDSILTTYQEEPEPEFQLPGGGIDPGESPLQALHREVFEETGWHIAKPRKIGAFRRFTWMPDYGIWAEKICLIYVARPTRCIANPTEPGHSAIWMPLDLAVSRLDGEGDRQWVARYSASDKFHQRR